MIFIYAKNVRKLQNIPFLFDLRNNTISNLCEQPQCKSVTIRLTRWSSRVEKQFDLLCNTWRNCKIFFINVHNIKYILSGTYFCPSSVKIENQAVSAIKNVTKMEEPLNLNLEESSEEKNLAFPVSLC